MSLPSRRNTLKPWCSPSGTVVPRSTLNVFWADDTHGAVHDIRFLYAASEANGARDTSAKETSRAAKCVSANCPMLSVNMLQPGQPAVGHPSTPGANVK